jgi:hypothetical protein
MAENDPSMHRYLHPLLAAALLASSLCAFAQGSYRCTGPQGVYYADRPCITQQGSTKLGGYGPAPDTTPPPHQPPPAAVGRAPEHQSYMSPECASLNDGLRTAASRGLSYATQSDLRADYNRRCSANESQARMRYAEAQRQSSSTQRDQQSQAGAEARRNQADQQRTFEQCGEMRRIIASRKQRQDSMTPGELGDFKRFEANYAERCQARS